VCSYDGARALADMKTAIAKANRTRWRRV
jgi:hypothetical protein